jgi:hypothetical protein
VTTLRDGLRAPVVVPPPALVRQLVAFLEGQSRIRVAVWMGHEHGTDVDEHLLLGIDDRDWRESARDTILVGCRNHGSTLGPREGTIQTLYEAAA